jgi:ferredoxin
LRIYGEKVNAVMLTSGEIKSIAREYGADLVGIGSIDRWDEAPQQYDPRSIMPNAKSVICIGFRVHRGSLRGIEEQTYYSGYTLIGFADINNHIAPMVQRRIANYIEDKGYETTPVSRIGEMIGRESGTSALRADGSEKPRPDVFLNMRIGAMLCGVGEIGVSRLLLTPEFGPLQRLFLLISEATLEPDPIISGICDKCMECVKNCPGNALSVAKRDDLDIPGIAKITRSSMDFDKCAIVHGEGALSPFAPQEAKDYAKNIIDGTATHTADGKLRPSRAEIGENVGNKIDYVRNARHFARTASGLCGAEGCMRACLVHLEHKDRLTHKFNRPFRQ